MSTAPLLLGHVSVASISRPVIVFIFIHQGCSQVLLVVLFVDELNRFIGLGVHQGFKRGLCLFDGKVLLYQSVGSAESYETSELLAGSYHCDRHRIGSVCEIKKNAQQSGTRILRVAKVEQKCIDFVIRQNDDAIINFGDCSIVNSLVRAHEQNAI
jgi:hypothetical protein